ncbi:hypothetical protein A8B75_19180 [Sphingomonadales bacterium EhC05]|nr:hypothetical protein A8B75_19180 [Sphingomonadales bacterium EhC05]
MAVKENSDFHLISFTTREFKLPLFDQKNFDVGPKASVIIGPNGSSKSRVIAALVEEFINVDELRREHLMDVKERDNTKSKFRISNELLFSSSPEESKSKKDGSENEDGFQAQLKYRLENAIWTVERIDRSLSVWKNGKRFNKANFPFPDRAIAVAHLPTDRFKFTRNRKDDFYVYLGLRQATNMTTTGAIESKVVLGFIDAIRRNQASAIFKNWFSDLELSAHVKVEIGFARRAMYEVDSLPEFRENVLVNLERHARGRRSLRGPDVDKKIHEIDRFWSFYQALRSFPILKRKARLRSVPRAHAIAFDPEYSPQIFYDFDVSEMIDLGRRLYIISNTALVFSKSGHELQFSELSSGEQQILGTVIRFVAELGRNSIVVIDEPEVSLHPAWQRMYLPRILQTLKQFPQTHAIIATHSHFMVSDVSEKQASLTVATNNPDSRFVSFEGDVFGRSPENILYRVFGIATTSNFYVERDLTKALRIISGVDPFDFRQLSAIYERLQVVNEPDNEALVEILNRIESVLERGVS